MVELTQQEKLDFTLHALFILLKLLLNLAVPLLVLLSIPPTASAHTHAKYARQLGNFGYQVPGLAGNCDDRGEV